jgi:hypothetical protein
MYWLLNKNYFHLFLQEKNNTIFSCLKINCLNANLNLKEVPTCDVNWVLRKYNCTENKVWHQTRSSAIILKVHRKNYVYSETLGRFKSIHYVSSRTRHTASVGNTGAYAYFHKFYSYKAFARHLLGCCEVKKLEEGRGRRARIARKIREMVNVWSGEERWKWIKGEEWYEIPYCLKVQTAPALDASAMYVTSKDYEQSRIIAFSLVCWRSKRVYLTTFETDGAS